MKDLLISFSGGRTSAFMCAYIQASKKYDQYNKLFVFANTGKEREQTLIFADKCDKYFGLNLVWVEANRESNGSGSGIKYVDFTTASRNGEPFEQHISFMGLPNYAFRTCTRDLKLGPIHKAAKEYFGVKNYITALGIRSDEPKRLKEKEGFIYPLANDVQVDKFFIRQWWAKQPFDLGLKDYEGNCDLCFLKSLRKRKTILSENQEVGNWWQTMEGKYGTDAQPIFDIRNKLSVEQIKDESQQPFYKAEDESIKPKLFDPIQDFEMECFCKE